MYSEMEGSGRKKFDSEKIKRAIDAEYDNNRTTEHESNFHTAGAGRARNGSNGTTGASYNNVYNREEKEQKRAELESEINAKLFSHRTRLIFSFFTLIMLIWIESAAVYSFILPVYISLNQNVKGYLAADLILLLITGALCLPELKLGTVSFFTFRPCSGSLAFLAFFGAFVNDLYLLAAEQSFPKNGALIYSSIAAAVLVFTLFSRIASLRRRRNTLAAMSLDDETYSLQRVDVSDTGEKQEALYPVKTFSPDPEERYTAPMPQDTAAKYLSLFLLIAAIIMLALNLAMNHGVGAGIASFAAVCSIGSPVFFSFGAAVSFLRVSRRLRKKNAMISGYAAVADLADTQSVIADANLIFPPETVAIHAIKTFAHVKIEKAILDAASLVSAVDGPLKKAFIGLMHEDSGVTLEHVENAEYLDDLGYTAIVGSQRVLLGNRDLMRTKNVQTPSREYEAKYAAQGRDILYLAVDGELCAMFIAGYYSSKEIIASLKKMEHNGIAVFVKTNDANITPSLLAERMGEDYNSVTIVGSEDARIIDTASRRGVDTGLAFSGSMIAYAEAMTACRRLRNAVKAITVMQVVASVLGVLLIAYCSLTGIRYLTPVAGLEFQAVLALPTFLLALLRKN